jgi:hypothetical protein
MSELPSLSGPFEILDLEDGGSISIIPVTWERGTMQIKPLRNGGTTTLIITALRIHVSPETKGAPPNYWDITSKTLQAQLMPLLLLPGYDAFRYVITKHGVAPKARFTLERAPL